VCLAATGRPITPDQQEALAAEVEDAMRLEGAEVASELIGAAVLRELRALDEVAYLRFASVHKSFDDVADFQREARLLTEGDD
jgi:transcriptional repressor NrdR